VIAIPVAANEVPVETVKVTGGGNFVADATSGSLEGNRCYFGVEADSLTNQGHGSFMDKDLRLKAILTADNVAVVDSTHVKVEGVARLYQNNKKLESAGFELMLADNAPGIPPGDRLYFKITSGLLDGYYWHGDLEVNGNGEIVIHPRD
jgi:hypothetical protein